MSWIIEGCPELLVVKCPEEDRGRHLVSQQHERPLETLSNKVHNDNMQGKA